MVGGVADWFAVTALFRHPLGLPIPHTAIIPRKKDQIGRALAGFVQQNFLNGPVVAERLQAAEIPRRAGEWLSDPTHAAALAADIGTGVGGAASVLRDDELRAAILGYVDRRLHAARGRTGPGPGDRRRARLGPAPGRADRDPARRHAVPRREPRCPARAARPGVAGLGAGVGRRAGVHPGVHRPAGLPGRRHRAGRPRAAAGLRPAAARLRRTSCGPTRRRRRGSRQAKNQLLDRPDVHDWFADDVDPAQGRACSPSRPIRARSCSRRWRR